MCMLRREERGERKLLLFFFSALFIVIFTCFDWRRYAFYSVASLHRRNKRKEVVNVSFFCLSCFFFFFFEFRGE